MVLRKNPARGIGGGNDALGRISILSYVPPFVCLMGEQGEPNTIRSEKGRCSPHPPRGPSFILAHLYAAPQDVGLPCMPPDVGNGPSPPIMPGLCMILHLDFGEFSFYELR
jgi:hypothetical protein